MAAPPPTILRTTAEVRDWTTALAREGRSLALVPTMGALHDGHLELMRRGARLADEVATSVFVNPTQFGPKEDLAKYPRDLAGDCAKCATAGVRVVFAPTPEVMYPAGFQSAVEVERVSQGLCGARRPGHFRGVATVVTKLLALFRPKVALFGEKDFQQLKVIEALNRDLELGVEILGIPTVRDADGLALSSRNAFLSAPERVRALALSRGLKAAQAQARAGERDAGVLVATIRQALAEAEVREDYVELRDEASLEPVSSLAPLRPARALVAGFVGTTRLIDNLPITLGA